MPDVLGLDLGLANVGAASLTDRGSVATWHLQTDPAAGIAATTERITRIVRWCTGFVTTGTVLAVVEAPSFGSEHGQQHERAAVHWRVLTALVRRDIPIAVCPPATLKKWATGSGRASKTHMKRSVEALWPNNGLRKVTEHEIDALALAGLGAQCWAEWPGPWLGPSPTALATINWPEKP